jgi:type III pantothenate kinase
MILYLDVGNTALKWRWRSADGAVHQGDAVHRREWHGLVEAMDGVPLAALSAVYVASVAGHQADQDLAVVLRRACGVEPCFYYSPAADAGVVNAYEEPARLGVDRWLAVVQAWHRHGAAIVVDCGSALTIDAVDANGQHLGGYIVPGLAMMERSLIHGTGSIRLDDPLEEDSLQPGCSTAEGVRRGVLRMTVAFITDAVVALRQGLPDTCPVLLTGGDATRVARHLAVSSQWEPDLVLDGLERVTGN